MGEDGHGLANRPVGVPKVVALDPSALQVCWTLLLNFLRAWLLHTIFLANQTLSRSIESFLLVFLLLVSDLRPAYEKVVPGCCLKTLSPATEPTCGRDTTSAVCIVSGVVFVRIFAYRPDTFTS